MDSLQLYATLFIAVALLFGGLCVLLINRGEKKLQELRKSKDEEIKVLSYDLKVEKDISSKLRASKRCDEQMYKSKLDYFYNFINYNRLGVASHSEKELALAIADSSCILTLAEIYKYHQEEDTK